MIRLVYLVTLLAVPVSAFAGEEERFALPERGRPRIRRYDQRPVHIDSGHMPMSLEEESDEVTKVPGEVSLGFRLDTGSQYGFGRVEAIPLLGPVPREQEQEGAEEGGEDDSFLNPMDFLTEEDLIPNELEETEEESGDGEVMAWDSLEESMMEDAMETEREETQEERERTSSEAGTGLADRVDAAETGLGLTYVLSGEQPGDSLQSGGEQSPAGRATPMARAATVNSALRMDLLRASPEGVGMSFSGDGSAPEPLSQSRKLFSEIRERWEPGSPAMRSVPVQAPTLSPMSASASLQPSVPMSDPVTPRLPSAIPMPDPVQRPAPRSDSSVGGNPRESNPISRDRFRPDDGRVRSLIGGQP